MKISLLFQSSLFTLLVGGTAGKYIYPHEKCMDQLDYDAFEGPFQSIDLECFFNTDNYNAPCHSSCKSCINAAHWQGEADGDGLNTGGSGFQCFRCADGSEVEWPVTRWEVPVGYCSVASSCGSKTQALDTCLASNEAVCPTREWLISASMPQFPFRDESGDYFDISLPFGLTEADVRNYDVTGAVKGLHRRMCNGIVAMSLGLTMKQSGYPECPCAPQLYDQLYCYESDSFEFLNPEERLLNGKTVAQMLPAASSDPMQEVCSNFIHPTCTILDVDPSMEGCLTPECTILPDCQCIKKCKTCGWWNSLAEVHYNEGSTRAGDEGVHCTSCHDGSDVNPHWNQNGAGNCYGDISAASPPFTLGAMLCSIGMLVVAVLYG